MYVRLKYLETYLYEMHAYKNSHPFCYYDRVDSRCSLRSHILALSVAYCVKSLLYCISPEKYEISKPNAFAVEYLYQFPFPVELYQRFLTLVDQQRIVVEDLRVASFLNQTIWHKNLLKVSSVESEILQE